VAFDEAPLVPLAEAQFADRARGFGHGRVGGQRASG
jgi:hypothetical protein